MDRLDVTPIQEDVDSDCRIARTCESCSRKPSRYLYILKNVFYGIFHLCQDCKEEMEYVSEEVKEVQVQTTFVEKEKHTWSSSEVLLR